MKNSCSKWFLPGNKPRKPGFKLMFVWDRGHGSERDLFIAFSVLLAFRTKCGYADRDLWEVCRRVLAVGVSHSVLSVPIQVKPCEPRFHVPALDLQAEQAAKVEKMRQSILEGLNLSRQSHPLPFPPPAALPFYPASVYPRHFGPVPPAQGRGRGFAGECAGASGRARRCGGTGAHAMCTTCSPVVVHVLLCWELVINRQAYDEVCSTSFSGETSADSTPEAVMRRGEREIQPATEIRC